MDTFELSKLPLERLMYYSIIVLMQEGVFASSSDEKKREGGSGKRAEDFQEFTVTKETTTLKLRKKSKKGCFGNLPYYNRFMVSIPYNQ